MCGYGAQWWTGMPFRIIPSLLLSGPKEGPGRIMNNMLINDGLINE